MNDTEITRRRLRSLHLSGDPFEAPEDVVRWLGAVQSQDFAPAKWSIAQRTGGETDTALERAFAGGAILRTHILRPTWHFVSPEDIRWMLELTAPRVQALNARFYRQQGLDDSVLERCNALLAGTLAGGQHRTRLEIAAILQRAAIPTDGLRLGAILMNAELTGVVCSGARRGKQHTYALLAERAPQARRLSRDEALAELTLRYFTSHGPATEKDFRWWSSLTLADIRQGLDLVASRLEHEVVDGRTHWFSASPPAPDTSPSVHLLQGYDEYIVGYSESKYLIDLSGVARSLPRARGIYTHAVILDGQAAGQWKGTPARNAVVVEAALFTPFDGVQTHALQAAAERYAAFLGVSVTLVTKQV